MCASPRLIAAYRGLHRLRIPRHPPHALVCLTTKFVAKQSTRLHRSFLLYDQYLRVTLQNTKNVLALCERHSRIGFVNPTIYHTSVVKQRRNVLQDAPKVTQRDRMEASRCKKKSMWEKQMYEAKRLTGSFQRSIRLSAYSRSVKEVIQPQVPLRLPCYDFAPVTALAFGRLPPCGLRHGLRALTASMA